VNFKKQQINNCGNAAATIVRVFNGCFLKMCVSYYIVGYLVVLLTILPFSSTIAIAVAETWRLAAATLPANT
jgi:hypothetical protein